MKTKKDNTKLNKIRLYIVVIIFIIVIVCFFYNIYKLVIQPTKSFVVERGKIYKEEQAIGYVIRDESVIKGQNYKNGIVQIKNEGEKVSKGDPVFRYYSNNESDLVKRIEELDNEIQDAMSEQNDFFSSDMKLLDKQINEILGKISTINSRNLIDEYKKNINNLITKKAKIAGELSPAGSYIKKLIEKRSTYENELNSGAEYINAERSGIVSYRVDGLEETLTPNSFNMLSSEYLAKLNLKTGQIISASNERGKIVNNFECYIATLLKSDKAKEAKVNDNITIRLSNLNEINSKIEYIAKESDGSILLVFKINKEVERLINYRKISFDVIWWSYEGLKIPNNSILQDGGISYIIRNRVGYTDKIAVKILKQNDDYAIIDNYTAVELQNLGYSSEEIKNMRNITLNDEILLNPSL